MTGRAKSTAISYLSIFRQLHNKKCRCFLLGCMFERRAPYVMNELTCEKAGNLFQVETIQGVEHE